VEEACSERAKGLGYMINVASTRNGVGYGKWVHIDGWSDAVVRFITERERADSASE
jgi:60 kDa SS-A/Ro ribonucleoprotein